MSNYISEPKAKAVGNLITKQISIAETLRHLTFDETDGEETVDNKLILLRNNAVTAGIRMVDYLSDYFVQVDKGR